jgi:hypothetical protein
MEFEVLTVATLAARNVTRLWRRLWWGLAESAFGGNLEADGQFCVGAFGRNLASVAVKMFPRLIYFIKTFYKLCIFNGICKDNSVMNCIKQFHSRKL